MARPFEKGNTAAVGSRGGDGGPPGNTKALKHGLIYLRKALRTGKIQHLRGIGRVIEEIKAEIVADIGGDPSAQEKIIIDDTAKILVFAHSIDGYLLSLPNIFETKGAAGWLEERRRLGDHITANLRALGLKRVARDATTLETYIQQRYGQKDGATGE